MSDKKPITHTIKFLILCHSVFTLEIKKFKNWVSKLAYLNTFPTEYNTYENMLWWDIIWLNGNEV